VKDIFMVNQDFEQLAKEEFGYLTTTGRVSGRQHTIEIWFALEGRTIYMLAGGRDKSDWVKNARKQPKVGFRIGDQHFQGHARELEAGEEDSLVRRIVVAKYQPIHNEDLSDWGRTSLAVAIDL
jgi:deazaflavin-dependent oxidoreductase (nitroreductase family)